MVLAAICSCNKYDINLLNDYIDKLLNNKYMYVFDSIIKVKTQVKKDHYPFFYGVDEFFFK